MLTDIKTQERKLRRFQDDIYKLKGAMKNFSKSWEENFDSRDLAIGDFPIQVPYKEFEEEFLLWLEFASSEIESEVISLPEN